MNRNELNLVYRKLEEKATELSMPFVKIHSVFKHKIAYFSGHYRKDEHSLYKMDFYPIPVISIKGFCDIEVDVDRVCISTKLSKKDAIAFDYKKLEAYDFEVYGVKNYLDDFYIKGQDINDLKRNIESSKESEIGFSFKFDDNLDADMVYKFVLFLRKSNFYN